jgi:murein DD-endopeptidase MepM/ murein hydrolase activator NlpD
VGALKSIHCFIQSIRKVVRTMQKRPKPIAKITLSILVVGLFAGAAAIATVTDEQSALTKPDQTLIVDVLSPEINIDLDNYSVFDSVNDFNELSIEPKAQAYISETRIRSGDTLSSIMGRLSLNEPGLIGYISQNKEALSAHKLYPGRTVVAALDSEGNMQWVRYYHTPGDDQKGTTVTRYLEITKDATNDFEARESSETAETQTQVAVGTIESSLFAATDLAGVPDAITSQMAEILGGKIDFHRDMRRGDQFRVIYETRTHRGRPAGSGKVLAVEFVNKGVAFNATWYSLDGQSGNYYDKNGESLRGTFLRNAIKFSRVSSTFGMRKHPIHREWRQHAGVDFAAPTGTPIMATADGTVDFIGWQNGYGKVIVLRHSNKITTMFAHQSRFANGLKKGERVSQGDIIGYVGTTGWSTGAHLHYEMRVAGRPVDPFKATLPAAEPLSGPERVAFVKDVGSLQLQLEKLATLQTAVPDLMNVASR